MHASKNSSLASVWIKTRERLCGSNYRAVKFGGKWSEIFLITFAKISVNLGESISTSGWIITNTVTLSVFLIYIRSKWNYIIIIIHKKYRTLLLLFIKKYRSNNIPLLIIMLKYNEWTIDSKTDMNNKCEILLPEEG